MDLNETICFCNDVTIGMIKDAVDSGAKTLEDVQAQTGAGTVCGGCLDNIQAVIDVRRCLRPTPRRTATTRRWFWHRSEERRVGKECRL